MHFIKMSILGEIKHIFFWMVLATSQDTIKADKYFVNNQILLLHVILTTLDDSNLQ